MIIRVDNVLMRPAKASRTRTWAACKRAAVCVSVCLSWAVLCCVIPATRVRLLRVCVCLCVFGVVRVRERERWVWSVYRPSTAIE